MAVIGSNNRKSVLDEEASLYQEKDDRSEKQKWSEMNGGQRFAYFMDYYFLKCLIIVMIAGAVAVFLKHMLTPETPVVLSVAVVEDMLASDEKESFQEFLEQLCITDEKNQKIRLDDTYPSGYESLAKLQAYFNTNGIDLIITNEDHFVDMAEIGYFDDLNDLMPKLASMHEELLCWALEPVDDTSVSDNADVNVDSEGTKRAYGIRITDCEAFRDVWENDAEAVAGIVINGANKENAENVLRVLFEE